MSETLTGRELDCAIGERVMGWRWVPDMGRSGLWVLVPPERLYGYRPEFVRENVPWAERYTGRDSYPPYSTTWEGAGLVNAKLAADGWEMFASHTPSKILTPWDVRLFRGENARERHIAHGTTFPETLGLVALKTKGKGDGGE